MTLVSEKNLGGMAVDELLAAYVALCLRQFDANEVEDSRRYNATFPIVMAIETELESRAGDQRRALMGLFDHPNIQVRLQAARACRSVAPVAAAALLEEIKASQRFPQAADAGMWLRGARRDAAKRKH